MTSRSDEIRCSSRILGIITEDGLLEIKCSSSKCGAGKGVVVFHYVDLSEQKVVRTKKYRDADVAFVHSKKGITK